MTRAAVVIALVAGCSSSSPPQPATGPAPTVGGDAGVSRPGPSVAIAADDVAVAIPAREPRRPGRPIEIMLRSSPPHSLVAVDGKQLGITPQVWEGATGGEHEFTFVLKNHAVARYRFVPITSGVVHARLEPIVDDTPGGITAPPEVAPPQPPAPPTVHAPEPPVIDAGAVTPPPGSDVSGPGPQP